VRKKTALGAKKKHSENWQQLKRCFELVSVAMVSRHYHYTSALFLSISAEWKTRMSAPLPLAADVPDKEANAP